MLSALLGLAGAERHAQAAGYDTPVVYSARHAGMGGAAVSYVRDASAIFHNPAGLGNIKRANVLGDFSLILGNLRGSPQPIPSATSVDSDGITAPVGLIGGAFRLTDFLVLGGAVYPVAASGGEYTYPAGPARITDETRLIFFEFSPAIAFNAPKEWGIGRLNLGFSYRIVFADLDRLTQAEGADPAVDFSMSGTSFDGFRLGLQWSPIELLSFGIHYRSRTATELTGDEGVVTLQPPGAPGPVRVNIENLEAEFILPARLSFGARVDYLGIGLAVDAEYAFQSQNRRLSLTANAPALMGAQVSATNVFLWQDAWTIRVGGEYTIDLGALSLMPRLGYIYDGETANRSYPTAFGAPPAETHSVTAGLGARFSAIEVAVAYAYRVGSADVSPQDIAARTETCDLCGFAGEYRIETQGLFVDFSYDFD